MTNCNKKAGYIGAAVGAVLAVLILFVGFWKTILIAVFAGVGYLIGASDVCKGGVKETINRVVPNRDDIHTQP